MNTTQISLTAICIAITLLLFIHLWIKQPGSLLKKGIWSLILCIPFAGWISYGAFYSPPGSSDIRAGGRASGWANHWPK